MKKLKTCTTIEEFWHIYSHLARPNELPPSIDYHFFREGIVPLWEDAANQKGGKWVVRMKKGLGNRCWEDILLAVLGDQFGLRDEICGVVMQCKLQEDVLSIWNRNASDRNIRLRIRDVLKEALSIPFNHLLEYKAHDQSIRNTLKNNR